MNTLGKSLTVVAITLMLLSTLRFSSVAAEGDVWTPKSPMLTARAGLGVVAVNGKIYAIGGMNNNSYLNVNEEYDPVTDKWTTKTPMPTARSGFAIATYQNRIYVFGGTIGDSTTNSSGFTGITQVYTPGTDTWTTKTSMPTPRADLSASVVNGKIYLIGGKKYVEHDPYYEESNINEVYDPGTDSWINKTSIPTATFGYASAVLDNKIYIIGGGIQFWERWDFTFVKANQIYDAENDDWTVGATFDPSLSYMAAAATSGIVANPGTITGSIGVIMGFTDIQGLLQKIGVSPVVVKSGQYKDIGSPVRTMTDPERTILQTFSDQVHRQFITAIAEGRHLEYEKVVSVADGRILSGENALELGLVDRLGNLEDAIAWAGEMGGITGKVSAVYAKDKKHTFIKRLAESSLHEILNQLSAYHLFAGYVL